MAKALTVPSVEPLNITGDSSNLPSRWERWLRSFRYFVTGSGITDKTQKRALLLHLVGPDVQHIFETLEDTGEDNDFDQAATCLIEYFKPKKNINFERHKFNSANQNKRETVQDFATRLKQLAISCEFTDTKDRIRDQIVEKCSSATLRRKFLCEKDLTLEKVLELSSTYERANESATKMEETSRPTQEMNDSTLRIREKHPQRFPPGNVGNSRFEKRQQRFSASHIECYSCGYRGHKSTDETCPAKHAMCTKCQKIGHFAKKCITNERKHKKKNRQKVRSLESGESNSESDTSSDYTFILKDKFENSRVNVQIGNIPISMIIDSGATCNIIDRETWTFLKSQRNFNCLSHGKTNKKIYAYGNASPLKLAGLFRADVEAGSVNLNNIEFTVLDGKGQSLLGKDTAIKLNVLRVGLEVFSLETDSSYPNLFSGIGKLKDYQLHIPIDESVDPVIQSVRRIPYHLREKLENKLDSLEDMDIIEKVQTPSRWVSPVVIVPKGDDIRLCLDMRLPNMAVKRVHHTIPTVEDVLQELNNAKIFSKLDIRNAYHQLELDEPSREITTFVTHKGQYRYKWLVFGISCASEMYQNVLQQILQNCKNTRNIMDDIFIYGKNQNEHDECLRNVLKVLSASGFTLNCEKCVFNMSQLVFMGNVVSEHGVGPTKAKVQDVLDARAPKNASEVRSFLGLVNFNARYIADLSTVSEPLRRLTRKHTKFSWGQNEEKSFNELKQRLANAETLGFFDKNANTQLICDASPVGLSAMLVQQQGDEKRVICYASRSLSPTEQKYSQLERECLGLIFGVERFHIYLFGTEFELLTDCKPLQFLFAPRSKPSARIERWILRIQSYKFKIRHIKGCENFSDCLSRLCKQDRDVTDRCVFMADDEYIVCCTERNTASDHNARNRKGITL